MYKVYLSDSAKSDLKKAPRVQARSIVRKLKEIGKTGRGNIEKIREELWKLRAGEYRVYFYWEENQIRVVRIFHRRIAYRLDIIESLIKRIRRERATV